MKTFEQRFDQLIDLTNGKVLINEAVYKQIQREVLEECKTLCLEGATLFERLDKGLASGCKECANNINDLILELK